IHYIWSPTVHRTWKWNYFSKYKLLFSSTVRAVLVLVKACRRSFLPVLGRCRTPDLVDWPCADHMHSPMKKPPKNISSNTHQTEHVQSAST
ncbi:unnamed protein product, partial [Staurois parvus]